MDDKIPVTVLGLGPMGRALARTFLHNGHAVTVWNRTAAKADELVAAGARRAATPADAAAASPLVVVCVLDYDAAHAILAQAEDALPGRTLVNLTADTPRRARATAAWAAERGVDYLDGAILSPAPTIGTSDAAILYSGPKGLYLAHEATLAPLSGTTAHVGEDHSRAAAYEVGLLDLFWTSMTGLAHAFALARAEGVTPQEFAPYAKGVAGLLPVLTDDFAERIDQGRYEGVESTLRSAVADMSHAAEAAAAHGLDTSVLRAALTLGGRALDAGRGDDDFARMTEVMAGQEPPRERPM